MTLLLIALPVQAQRGSPAQRERAALSLFARSIKHLDQGRYAEALKTLRAAAPGLPKLADHIAYSLASAEFQLKEFADVTKELAPVWDCGLPSPYRSKAALLAARAHLENGAPREAVRVLRLYYSDLPQPEGDSLLAASHEAAGDPAAAADYYQRVYYGYPSAVEAGKAGSELARLHREMGDSYPPPTAQAMLDRAGFWLRTGQYKRAKSEYEALTRQLAGLEQDLARVRIGAAQYSDYETISAFTYLRSFETSHPDAEAERLYYLAECARRLDRDDEMRALVNRLGELCPQSSWRMKALISVGNHYLVQNQPEIYEPLFRACYETFTADPQAAHCHWKVAWSLYMRRQPEAAQALRDHLLKFPGSEKASTALYFLGRLAEASGDLAAARAYYDEAVERFPNRYYSLLAEKRLLRPEFLRAVRSDAVTRFLNRVVWPVRSYPENFQPAPETRLRLERYRLLLSAGLSDLAEQELGFGAKADRQPHVLALELAQFASRQGRPHQAIRLLKNVAPGYLSFPVDMAPLQFWKLLFPLPYRSQLERYAKLRNLDLFLLAGLIRQESEFNPAAVSPANAYGLTQILPSNGRLLMRKLGQRRFRPGYLLRPDTNLRLGTYYLRSLLDQHGGRLEPALAAYNAGPTRVQSWLTWGKFEEPAEFIETIPFTETRTYVVAVLRNAELYRRLYAGETAPKLVTDRALAAKQASSGSGKGFKRTPTVPKKKKRPRNQRL